MKNRYIIHIAIASLLILSVGCKKKTTDPDPEPTLLELQLKALQNEGRAWGITGGSVTKDGYDVSSQFNGFTLSFGEFTYTTQNGLVSAWPGSGTWKFSNKGPNKIERDDGIVMGVNLTNNNLTLKYTVSGKSGGKVKGIEGEFTFVLISK
jgi:hypothetical protein